MLKSDEKVTKMIPTCDICELTALLAKHPKRWAMSKTVKRLGCLATILAKHPKRLSFLAMAKA